MTTPPDPQRQRQQPDEGPYAPGGYGGRQPPYPGQYGGQPYPGQPGPYPDPGQHGRAYNGQGTTAYPYNPYAPQFPAATQFPAGLDDVGPQPARRPGVMSLSLVLLILSALPYLGIGLLALIGAGGVRAALPPDQVAQFQGAFGIDIVTVLLVLGAVFTPIALAYIIFAILAFQGRNWARIAITVMTVGFLIVGVLGVAGGGVVDVVSFLVVFGPTLLAIIGTILLFLPDSSRFFAGPRR